MKTDDFLWTCKKLYLNNIHPFDFDKADTEDYLKIIEISKKIIQINGLQSFLGLLMEYQYRINFWAAFLGLEIGNPDNEEILIISGKKTIRNLCIEIVEENLNYKSSDTQRLNGLKWIEEQKNTL